MGALGKSDTGRGGGEPRSPSTCTYSLPFCHPGVIVAESAQEGGTL